MPSEFTIKRVLKCAETIFLEKGYDAARTREIAERSGVSEATIFKYFKSKEDILSSVVAELSDKFARESREKIGAAIQGFDIKKGGYRALLAGILEERMGYFLNETALIRLLVREMPVRPELRKIFASTVYGGLSAVIDIIVKQGSAAGEFSGAGTAEAVKEAAFGAVLFNSFINGALDRKPDNTAVKKISSLIAAGL